MGKVTQVVHLRISEGMSFPEGMKEVGMSIQGVSMVGAEYRRYKAKHPTGYEASVISINTLVAKACDLTGATYEEVFGSTQYGHVVRARGIVWWMLRELGWVREQTAALFNMNGSTITIWLNKVPYERDHTTLGEDIDEMSNFLITTYEKSITTLRQGTEGSFSSPSKETWNETCERRNTPIPRFRICAYLDRVGFSYEV